MEECVSGLCCTSKLFLNDLPTRYPRKSKTSFLDGFDDDEDDSDDFDDEEENSIESHNRQISRRFSRLYELDLSLTTLPGQLTMELQNVSPGSFDQYNSTQFLVGDTIQILNISNCEIEDNVLSTIALPRNLVKLVLSCTEIQSLNDISSLPKLKKLQVLECASCMYLEPPLIADTLLPDSLKSLDFSYCTKLLTLNPLNINLSNLRELRTLNLSNTDFNDEYLFNKDIKAYVIPPYLEELDISSTRVGEKIADSTTQIFPKSLRKLRLYRCKNVMDNSAILRCLPKNLTHLDISCTTITSLDGILPSSIVNLDVSSTNLERVPLLSNLIFLDANYCENLEDISFLSQSNIEELELINCKRLKDPKGILNFKRLKCLKVTGCKEVTSDLLKVFNDLYESF